MRSTFLDDYWEPVSNEVENLEKMGAWDIVDRIPDINVLELTL